MDCNPEFRNQGEARFDDSHRLSAHPTVCIAAAVPSVPCPNWLVLLESRNVGSNALRWRCTGGFKSEIQRSFCWNVR